MSTRECRKHFNLSSLFLLCVCLRFCSFHLPTHSLSLSLFGFNNDFSIFFYVLSSLNHHNRLCLCMRVCMSVSKGIHIKCVKAMKEIWIIKNVLFRLLACLGFERCLKTSTPFKFIERSDIKLFCCCIYLMRVEVKIVIIQTHNEWTKTVSGQQHTFVEFIRQFSKWFSSSFVFVM